MLERSTGSTCSPEWLVGGGEMGERIRAFDWSATPLGPRSRWPAAMRSVVNLVVSSRFPMALLWGRDLLFLYNDAYRDIAGQRHPRAMGRSTREIWPEVWHINQPIFAAVMDRGETVYLEDQLFPIEGGGGRVEHYFTLSYSPVRIEGDGVAGALVTLLETTATVRRREALEAAAARERRKHEEEAARLLHEIDEQRTRLQAIIDSLPVGLWIADRSGRMLVINEHARELWGGEAPASESVAGYGIYRAWWPGSDSPIPPEDMPMARALRGEICRDAVIEIERFDGSRGREVVSASPIQSPEGGISGCVAVVQDVTELWHAQEALHASEAQLQKALETPTVGVLFFTLDGTIQAANSTFERMSGYTVEELRSTAHWKSLTDPAFWEATEREAAQIAATGQAPPYEKQMIRKDGSRWWGLFAPTRLSGSGPSSKCIEFIVDITDQKRAEEELRTRESDLARAQAAAHLGSWRWDLRRDVVSWSEELFRIFGVDPTSFVPSNEAAHAMIHPADRELHAQAVARALRGQTVGPFESRIIRPNGEQRIVQASGFDVQFDEARRPTVLFGTILDITERKTAEEALRDRERVQRLLAKTGELAARVLKVDDLVKAVGEQVAKELGVSRCGFSEVDLDAGTVTVLDDYHRDVASIAGVYAVDTFMEHWMEEGLAGLPAVIEDVSTHPRTADLYEGAFAPIQVRAHLTVPLHRGGKWVANFWASHHEARQWTPRDVETLKLVAERVWSFVERNRAEEALRAKEYDLTEAQRLARIGSWFWEPKSDQVTLSDEGLRIFGFDRGQTVPPFEGHRERCFPADEWERLKQAMQRAYEDGRSYHLDLRALRAGRPLWIAARGETARDRRGRVTGVRGTVQDITERKSAEEALFRREAVLAQAGQMAHLGAWEIEVVHPEDLSANTLTWSTEVYRIFGYQPGTLPVTNDLFFERVHPDDRARVAAALSDAITNRHPYSIEHRIVRPDGTERVVQENAELIFNDRGTLIRVIGAVQDVTERKQIEDALREQDRRKTEFMGMLSHELRNPLTPIRNSLYILERAAPGGDQALRAHRVIDRQTAHLARLVDDLLDVTRIARGKIKLQKHQVELCALARRTIEDYRSLFARNEIELAVEDSCDEAWIRADPTRVAQVIGNLLQNALKFTNSGGRTTVVIREDRDSRVATLEVRDTGQGVDPSLLPRMFEPFVQADQALDRSKGGLGLGLALVKQLVELHGGTVTARSAGLGMGAEFCVSLPLDRSAAESQPARLGGRGARHRVLVIEDNKDAAESLKEALALHGHQVAVALSGPEGLAKAREFMPQVVLCDIGLPGMSGYEVARAFRGDPALRQIHLVALTGYAAPEDQQRAKQAGFDVHLSKPPALDKVEEALGGAHPMQ